jgi:hypothetical protein
VLRSFSGEFLERASGFIREVGFFEEEVVYEPLAEESISLYYILKGEVVSFVELGNSKTNNVELERFEANSTVGLFEFVRQLNYCHSLKAVKYSLLYVLDYENWIAAISEFEADCQNFYKIKHRAQDHNHLRKLQVKCKICNSNKHQTDMCLQDTIQCYWHNFLDRYLAKAHRRPHSRLAFKPTLSNEIRSRHIVFEPSFSAKTVKVIRKANSLVFKK